MKHPHNSLTESIPRWFFVLLIAFLIIQWGTAAIMFWGVPQGWQSVLAVPLTILKPISIGAAVLMSVVVAIMWFGRDGSLVQNGYQLVQRVGRSWIGVPVIVGILVLTSVMLQGLYLERWWGYGLLAGQGLILLALMTMWHYEAGHRFEGWFWRWLPVMVIVVGLTVRLWLMYVDFVWIDEGWRLAGMANMVRGGGLTPFMARYPSSLRFTPWWGGSFVIYGLWAKAFGLGLMKARWLSYMGGVIALPIVYLVIRSIYHQRMALISVSLGTLSLMFIRTPMVREDVFGMLFFTLGALTFVRAIQIHKPIWYVATGLVGVIVLEGHLTNLSYFAMVGGFFLVDYMKGIRNSERLARWHALWFFLMGAMASFAVYYAIHIVLADVTFRQYFDGISVGRPNESYRSLGSIIAWRATAAFGAIRAMWNLSVAETLLAAILAGTALFRRRKEDKQWLIMALFLVIGYVVVQHNGTVRHTFFGFSIWIASAGAFVQWGLKREGDATPLFQQATYGLSVLILLSWAVGYTREHRAARLQADAARASTISFVREYAEPDDPIIASTLYYPYLIDYSNWVNPAYPMVSRPPVIAEQTEDAYWLDEVLEMWPVLWVENNDVIHPVFSNYMEARHAVEVEPHIWLVDKALIVMPDYVVRDREIGLQMVGHYPLPDAIAGETLRLDTLWIIRKAVMMDYSVEIQVVDSDGETRFSELIPIMSGWGRTSTSDWEGYRFHDVTFVVPIPGDLEPGQYTLQLSMDGDACEPQCLFVVGNVMVVP